MQSYAFGPCQLNYYLLWWIGWSTLALAACSEQFSASEVDQNSLYAYPRLLHETGQRKLNLHSPDEFTYVYSVDFEDMEKGSSISYYILHIVFKDSSSTDLFEPRLFRTFNASQFRIGREGNLGLEHIRITGQELLEIADLSTEQLCIGGYFHILGTIHTNEGKSYTAANASEIMNEEELDAYFDFMIEADGTYNLVGEYEVLTTAAWCNPENLPYHNEVRFTLTPTGYDVTDFTFGGWDLCYCGTCDGRPLGSLRILVDCLEIEIIGRDQWGESYTWSNLEVDGSNLSFDWENTYGEHGSAVVIRPDGWPPLVLK